MSKYWWWLISASQRHSASFCSSSASSPLPSRIDWSETCWRRRERAGRRADGGNVTEAVVPRVFKVATVIVTVLLLLPIAIVVLMSVNPGEFLTFPPSGVSGRWIVNFFETEALWNG